MFWQRNRSLRINFATMKIRCIIPIILVIILGCEAVQAQSYKVFKGDTINRVDSKGKKQGVWKRYYENDQLFSVANFKDDVALGTTTTYYKTGERQSDLVHATDGKTSRMKMYWPNGKLKATGKYIGQSKDSIWVFYNQTDSISSIESYKLGKPHGKWLVYFSNGVVSEETNYLEGVKSGTSISYFADGKIKNVRSYKSGSLDGESVINHPSGKPFIKGTYSKGLMNGNWMYTNEYGGVDSVQTYTKGKLIKTTTK